MTDNKFNNIIDVDLSVTQKKKFRFFGNDDYILELNTSDMNIIHRLAEALPKLEALQQRVATEMGNIKVSDEDNLQEGLSEMSAKFKSIDNEMRNLIDYIFNADVSAKTAPDGSMYDPFNGRYRYEYIIEVILGLCEKNLQEESKKMEKLMKKHTEKYRRR